MQPLSEFKYSEKAFLKLLELYDCYKERLIQSPEVKEYFMQIVTTSKRTLQNKEFKQHLEDFELKVNLDENAMIELKQNRKVLNVKQEL